MTKPNEWTEEDKDRCHHKLSTGRKVACQICHGLLLFRYTFETIYFTLKMYFRISFYFRVLTVSWIIRSFPQNGKRFVPKTFLCAQILKSGTKLHSHVFALTKNVWNKTYIYLHLSNIFICSILIFLHFF